MLRVVSLNSKMFGKLDDASLPQIENARNHLETAFNLRPAEPAPIRAQLGKIFFHRGKATNSH